MLGLQRDLKPSSGAPNPSPGRRKLLTGGKQIHILPAAYRVDCQKAGGFMIAVANRGVSKDGENPKTADRVRPFDVLAEIGLGSTETILASGMVEAVGQIFARCIGPNDIGDANGGLHETLGNPEPLEDPGIANQPRLAKLNTVEITEPSGSNRAVFHAVMPMSRIAHTFQPSLRNRAAAIRSPGPAVR
jgi:hypothetical protein